MAVFIIPSETQSREFDGKLFLAALLADQGHHVYVGSRIDIHNRIASLPRAIYVAKDFRISSVTIFGILKRLGHRIVAWDEEGILFFDRAEFLQRRVAPEAFRQVEEFYAWSPLNKEFIEQAPCYTGAPVHDTGNPRVDLTRRELRNFFAPQVDELRSKFGDFILINTNFGKVNHFLPQYVVTPGKDDPSLRGIKMTESISRSWAYRRQLFEAFLDLIPKLAAEFPHQKIVIRPHPAENHATWQKFSQTYPNVHVLHEGSVYPWLMACAAMIHNGCTTGIEGFLLDARVYAYRPLTSKEFDLTLANDLSTEVFSFEDLRNSLKGISPGTPAPPKSEAKLDRIRPFVSSLSGPFAATLIAGHLSRFAERTKADTKRRPAHELMGLLHATGRRVVKAVNSHRRLHKNSKEYNLHRFPGLSIAEVQQKLSLLRAQSVSIGALAVREQHKNIFLLSKEER
jgi:surface carbohydrate biosynthesis protein